MDELEKREKVIKALEFCLMPPSREELDNDICSHDDCPYFREYDSGKCVSAVARDALALLKEQEQRVMTLEEVRVAHGSPLWFESKGTFRGEKGFWCLYLGTSPSFRARIMPAIGEQSTALSLSVYGSVWRCWTSRPTDEQRKAAKWDD